MRAVDLQKSVAHHCLYKSRSIAKENQNGLNNWMIDPEDVVMLLIDHQSGLFNTVKDLPVPDLRNYAIALAKTASLLNIPVLTTASVPDGPNGPLIPEIHQCAPHAQFIPRTGQINAWDNPSFVEAIEKTGRKTMVIAGTLTSVCMAFPAISAINAGYKAYAKAQAVVKDGFETKMDKYQ